MQIYGPNPTHGPQGLNGPHFRPKAPAAEAAAPTADRVELSPEALEASRLAEAAEARAAEQSAAPIRTDRVESLRAQIAEGSYETGDKLDAALDRLLDEIG